MEPTAADSEQGATLCHVEEISHLQLRKGSTDVLRRVAAGETILVTDNGRPVAMLSPPTPEALRLLAANGHIREALEPPSRLRRIERRRASMTTAEIVGEVRGRS